MPVIDRHARPSATPPLVSIVTPAYNAACTIETAIQSVLRQDYAHVEHIVVDGASTDGTVAVLERYTDRVRWLSEPDGGQSEAVNKGLALTRGEIIGWLNADDAYYPGAVRRAVNFLAAHPDVAMVYSAFDFVDGRGRCLKRIPARNFSLRSLLFANTVPQATMFFRRRVLAETGGVSPDYDFVMDWEFVWRVARHHRIERVPGVAGQFRLMPGAKSVAQAPKFWPEVITMLERLPFLAELVSPAALAEARRRAHLYAGIEFVRAGDPEQARPFLEQALAGLEPKGEPAVFHFLPGLLSTVVNPWHGGGVESPAADRCLEQLCGLLPPTGAGQHLRGLVGLYQGYRALKELSLLRAVRHWQAAFQAWPRLWWDLPRLSVDFLAASR